MRLKGWRTVMFNVAAGIVAAVEVALPVALPVLGMPEVHGVLPDGWLPWYVLVVALGNVWLRAVTDTPVGRDRS